MDCSRIGLPPLAPVKQRIKLSLLGSETHDFSPVAD